MASSFVDTNTVMTWLLNSAKAIEDGNLKMAEKFLHLVLILADETPYQFRVQSRVVKYFAEALARRAYGLHPASSNFTLPVNPAPYYRCRRKRIDGVIKKVIDDALMGKRRLHLIDFSIPSNYFEESVLCTLPNFSGDPLPVRVSYILPPFQAKHAHLSYSMEFLTRARAVNVELEVKPKVVNGNSLAEVRECEIDFIRSRDDEMVVVYYKFKLDKLVRDATAMKGELVRLREINPTIVIMLDFYSNHSDSNFLTCFEDSFQYSLKTLDIWQSEFLDEDNWELSGDVSEGNNVIRRHQTLSEWQRLFSMAGFTRIPLSQEEDNIDYETLLFVYDCDLFSGRRRLLEITRVEEQCLILGYEGCVGSPMWETIGYSLSLTFQRWWL